MSALYRVTAEVRQQLSKLVKKPTRPPLMWAETHERGRVHQPKYVGDAGFDLEVAEGVVIPPKTAASVPAGVRIALPDGVSALVLPRSSTARGGLLVFSTLIDSGYRGPMYVLCYNLSEQEIQVERGMRIAQLMPVRHVPLSVCQVQAEQLPKSERGHNGFGSSGGGL
jgi:dUTP pyrophosphatase